jgi:hypothetical protein
VLDEVDDIARATVSSITIATMLKLVDQERREDATSRPGARAVARAVSRVAE